MASSAEVLVLYKTILRHGRAQLKLTNQKFFRRLVREEFQKRKGETNVSELKFQKEVSWNIIYVLEKLNESTGLKVFKHAPPPPPPQIILYYSSIFSFNAESTILPTV